MAIGPDTLSRYGVPLGGGDGRGGLLMPKLKYRFRVRVTQFGPIAGGIEFTQQVMNINKPTVGYEKVTLDAYNSRAYVAGKHTWEPIQIALRDDITNTISRLVGHQIQKQLNHFEQTAFAAGQNYKFTTVVETMDGGNDEVLEQWTLEGCFLENVNYDQLDYATSDVQLITLSVSYDNATLAGGLFPLDNLGFQPGTRA